MSGRRDGGRDVPPSQHGVLGLSQWLSEAGQEETEKDVMSLVWKPERKGKRPGVGATLGPIWEAVQGPPGPVGFEALRVPWASVFSRLLGELGDLPR